MPASHAPLNLAATPASRPLRATAADTLGELFQRALTEGNGQLGAHCIHEQWMRDVSGTVIDSNLELLWQQAAATIPEWLPMRHVDWLRTAYAGAAQFQNIPRGRCNIYLVLLDYRDRNEPYGIYVGMSKYAPAERFDQHKAGIRAARSVLRHGLEVLTGPTLHLQHIKRGEAARIEEQLAEVLRAAGLRVEGGH